MYCVMDKRIMVKLGRKRKTHKIAALVSFDMSNLLLYCIVACKKHQNFMKSEGENLKK